MKSLTTNLSTTLDSIGVTKIGLQSLGPDTGREIGTGAITEFRHAEGIQPVLIDMLTILQTTSDRSLMQFRYT